MAHVPIVYVANDDVTQIIKSIGVKKKRSHVQLKDRLHTNELAPTFADSNANDNVPVASKPAGKTKSESKDSLEHKILAHTGSIDLLVDNGANNSCQMYSFKTPKKANQMSKYADSARKNSNRTVNEVDAERSPSEKKENKSKKLHASNAARSASRYQLRDRTNVSLIDADSDSDADDSSDDDADQLEDGHEDSRSASESTKPNSSRRFQLPSDVELYFEAHSGSTRQRATSNRTLQRLKNPRMNHRKVAQVLEEHEKVIERAEDLKEVLDHQSLLCRSYEALFTKWMFHLCHGFNLLLFGLGSKRNLLHTFSEKHLKGQDKLVVNGFFPGLSLKSILTSIIEDIMKQTCLLSNTDSMLDDIDKHYSCEANTSDLFLLIHNIDGVTLRAPFVQSALSRLASLPRIHVIASIDHINASLIWSQTVFSRFRWLWYDVTTYAPYTLETSYEGSLLLTGAGAGVSTRGAALALSGLLHVSRSLTSNAKGVFRILAERQIQDQESDECEKIEDITFSDLYQRCRERFLVNSELTLKAHLTEFIDHKLVHIRTGSDGCEYLSLTVNMETLKEYLEQEELS